jgi:hypothetical protein
MKKIFKFSTLYFIIFFVPSIYSQEEDTTAVTEWEFSAEADLYFTDPFIFLPIFSANREKLHLEARYNYEDLKTFSGWIGYNFYGGEEFEYFITPMIGGVVGRTNGIAPGLEFTLSISGFELYNESEYLFDLESEENNFFYNWTDLTYSPLDWLWFGISGQRTRLYQTELEIQYGLLLGGSYENWQFTGYLYNSFSDDTFLMLSIASDF